MRDNVFQRRDTDNSIAKNTIANRAYQEHCLAVQQLRNAGVSVHVFEDHGQNDTPDSVFPNNWFSTHHDGKLVIYPMRCQNRRREVRQDMIDFLLQHYQLNDTIDLRYFQDKEQYLEGTGSIVFDHTQRIAYASLGPRTCLAPLNQLCEQIGYQAHCFHSYSKNSISIYHTNVVLSVATNFALLGTDNIPDQTERTELIQQLESSGKTVIHLSDDQIHKFAANALELQARDGKVFALSTTAFQSLNTNQRQQIEKYANLLPLEVPTIELAGGSVRCMMAGNHLPVK
ncbi:amidinotransferase [Undibacterium sp. BYS107W]|uniref:Amidinotransferase n=2 Tax=Undibacterium baiyunense TaxID=2828731 RepID=A0A941I4D1_9BURK|nr:amidinotransferase [Undibacterium baiyunense]